MAPTRERSHLASARPMNERFSDPQARKTPATNRQATFIRKSNSAPTPASFKFRRREEPTFRVSKFSPARKQKEDTAADKFQGKVY
jgi:hypothetical protein